MRLGLALAVVCACGSVEKAKPDAGKDAPTIDAFVPAVALTIANPTNVDGEGEFSTFTVHIHTAKPSKVVNVAYSGSTGAITPTIDFVTTDGSGDGSSTVTYHSGAGSAASTDTATVVGTTDGKMSAPLMAMLSVVPLNRYGSTTPFPTGGGFSPGYLLGEKINVPTTGHLKRLGFISLTNGPNIKIGIYTDNNNAPGTLVTQIGATPIHMGVNEVQISPIVLAAGDYWYEAVYDASGSIGQNQAGGGGVQIDYIALPFASALPATFPAPTTYTANHFNYYLVVGQ